MALLLVLFILVLGYYYISAIPAEKAALRSTTGWISYVQLGIHGLRFIIKGILAYISFLLPFFFVLGVITLLLWPLFGNPGRYLWTPFFTFTVTLDGLVVHGSIVSLLAFNLCKQEIKKKNEQGGFEKYEEIKNQSAVLHLIAEAIEQQRLLRVSLKSRKIYIGIVPSEHFERLDLECIVLIPYFSGYRDKDTLKITLVDNYTTMYHKHHLIPPDAASALAGQLPQLEQFRIVIRLSEIESLSFFDMNYLPDFGTFHDGDDADGGSQ